MTTTNNSQDTHDTIGQTFAELREFTFQEHIQYLEQVEREITELEVHGEGEIDRVIALRIRALLRHKRALVFLLENEYKHSIDQLLSIEEPQFEILKGLNRQKSTIKSYAA